MQRSIGNYIKNIIWECILCSLAAAGLSANIYNGFDMNDTLSFIFPAVWGITLVLIFAIYMLCYNRISKIAGGCAGIMVLLALILYAQATHPFNSEETQSNGIFIIVLFASAVICFFITRIKVGCFILLAAGNLIIAAEVFLQFGLSVWGYIAFLFASCGLIFVYEFRKIRQRRDDESSLTARYTLQIAVIVGTALAAAAAIAMLVLVPLNLPTQEIKLIQELRSMEVVQKVGVAIFEQTLDEDSSSNNDVEDQKLSNDQEEPEEESIEENESSEEETANVDTPPDTGSGTGENEQGEETAQAIKYDRTDITWIVIAAAVILLIAASIAARKISRKRWYKRICALPRDEGIIELYRFFLKRLRIVKVSMTRGLTLEEYARVSRKFVEPFIYGEETFKIMTDVYERVYYGSGQASEDEWQLFDNAYKEIYDNIYDEVGKWRYLLLFYRI